MDGGSQTKPPAPGRRGGGPGGGGGKKKPPRAGGGGGAQFTALEGNRVEANCLSGRPCRSAKPEPRPAVSTHRVCRYAAPGHGSAPSVHLRRRRLSDGV